MAGFSSGKLATQNVDLTSSQTVSNKTLDASNDYSGDIIDPSRSDVKQGTQAELETYASGASNGQMCFATDTKQMYQVLDGALAAVGGGSGGLDTFFTDTFEVAGVSDYTSGNDAIFDNGGVLAGALADETVNNISGDQSLKYTQAAGSLNDFVKSPLIPIGKKQQGNTVGLELFYTYSGNSDDIKIIGYDDTGSEVMTLSSNLIKASSKAQRLSVQFPVPSGSVNLAWGIQVVVENIGAVLVVDDVQISTNPFVSKDIQGENTFSARIDNSGTATIVSQGGLNEDNINAIASVNRSSLGVVTVTFTTGFFSVIPSISGIVQRGTDNRIMSIDAISTSSVTLSTNISTSGAPVDVNFTLNITRQGSDYRQSTEHIVAYNSRNAENSMVRLHTGNGHGSVNNKIRRFSTVVSDLGNAITYADSATDGATFKINEDGVYMVSHSDQASSSSANVGISLNSSQLTTNIQSITSVDRLAFGENGNGSFEDVVNCSWAGQLYKDDIIRIHTDGNFGSGIGVAFTISKIGVGDLLGVPVPRTAYIKDVKPNGTSGGTFTSGAWQTRDLNTVEGDTEFVSLSSNQFTLEPGKYEIEVNVFANYVNNHKSKLRNITDSTDDLLGLSVYSSTSNVGAIDSNSVIYGTINITSEKTFEIQHRCSVTKATNGFGFATSFGVDEVYLTVKIKKVS